MYVFEIRPGARSWKLAPTGESEGLCFPTYSEAERRARWLAARAEVRGPGAEIRVLDQDGGLVASWRSEHYVPALRLLAAAEVA